MTHQTIDTATRVDVLAVMDYAADMLDTGEFEVDREAGRQLKIARDAVAELIAADRGYDEATRIANSATEMMKGSEARHKAIVNLTLALKLRRNALSRTTGAKP